VSDADPFIIGIELAVDFLAQRDLGDEVAAAIGVSPPNAECGLSQL
jgi:hypothetical protein